MIEVKITSEHANEFTVQEFNYSTGLHNFQTRFYDTDLILFYAVDQVGEFVSLYRFVWNNPAFFCFLSR